MRAEPLGVGFTPSCRSETDVRLTFRASNAGLSHYLVSEVVDTVPMRLDRAQRPFHLIIGEGCTAGR